MGAGNDNSIRRGVGVAGACRVSPGLAEEGGRDLLQRAFALMVFIFVVAFALIVLKFVLGRGRGLGERGMDGVDSGGLSAGGSEVVCIVYQSRWLYVLGLRGDLWGGVGVGSETRMRRRFEEE